MKHSIPLLALLSLACRESPVRWRDPAPLAAAAAEARLALNAAGAPALVAQADSVPVVPTESMCPGSLRTAEIRRGAARATVAVWWAPGAEGRAALHAAESPDGGRSWPLRAPVDTTERAGPGCARPAPAIATDDATGYVHVAYPLWAPEGAGVFFAHTMPGHFMFHQPVPVTYGERPWRVAVAASGDWVAVAFEDPNARRPRVGLSLSRSQGHSFEHAAVGGVEEGDASRPRVALRGRTLAVAWTRGADPTAPQFVRMGELSD